MKGLWSSTLFYKAELNFTSHTQTWLLPDPLNQEITEIEPVWQSEACLVCNTPYHDLKKSRYRWETKPLTCQSGKGYEAISKALGLQRTTVRAIIHKWRKLGTVVNLPRSGRPTKITPRAQRRLIQEVVKEPRTTSKELQASLASIKVSVHDSTIRKRLGKNSILGRVLR